MKENSNMKSSIIHSGIWASCIIGLTALIGCFWGSEGMKVIGITIAILAGLSIFFLSAIGISRVN